MRVSLYCCDSSLIWLLLVLFFYFHPLCFSSFTCLTSKSFNITSLPPKNIKLLYSLIHISNVIHFCLLINSFIRVYSTFPHLTIFLLWCKQRSFNYKIRSCNYIVYISYRSKNITNQYFLSEKTKEKSVDFR